MSHFITIYFFDRDRKIAAIKALRNIAKSRNLHLGLAQAKRLVDDLCVPGATPLVLDCHEAERPLLHDYLKSVGAVLDLQAPRRYFSEFVTEQPYA